MLLSLIMWKPARALRVSREDQEWLETLIRSGKTLEQYLEQLQIAVRFQEREGTALAGYLAKPPRAPRR